MKIIYYIFFKVCNKKSQKKYYIAQTETPVKSVLNIVKSDIVQHFTMDNRIHDP